MSFNVHTNVHIYLHALIANAAGIANEIIQNCKENVIMSVFFIVFNSAIF